jgi:hypothetical protein
MFRSVGAGRHQQRRGFYADRTLNGRSRYGIRNARNKTHVMSKTRTSLLLLAAGVAGAAVGALFAPKKGSETRADLKKRTGRLVGTVERNVKGKARELKSEVRAVKKRAVRSKITRGSRGPAPAKARNGR